VTAAVVAAPARVPVRGLAWVTWRQHRAALAGAVGALAGLALLLLATGLPMHAAADRYGLAACAGGVDAPGCPAAAALFGQRWDGWAMFLPRLLEFLPGVLGMFVGAPVVARELESGTHRFAWAQGAGRTGWLVVKLAGLGAVLLAAALAFSALWSWWYQPFVPLRGRIEPGQAYEVGGLVFAARTLFGFTAGVLFGTVIRRVVPAMAATALGWLLVTWPATIWLRRRIVAPLTVPADSPLNSDTSWTVDRWATDPSGHRLTSAQVDALFLRDRPATGRGTTIQDWLTAHGYAQWAAVQPDTRFWHFQLVEAGAYTLLALTLAAATVPLLRRTG
jgi:hypothetical protein